MRLLLDTNVLLWTLAGSSRIAAVRDLILSDETEVYVSAASWWEIVIKASLGKLDANITELRQAAVESGFVELSITGLHAEMLKNLPMLHRDPFDRMIVTQAITEPMRLLTGDALLAGYGELVRVI